MATTSPDWPHGLRLTSNAAGVTVSAPIRKEFLALIVLLGGATVAGWVVWARSFVDILLTRGESADLMLDGTWFLACLALSYLVARWCVNRTVILVDRTGLCWEVRGLPWRRKRHLAASDIEAISVEAEEVTEVDSNEVVRTNHRVVVTAKVGSSVLVVEDIDAREDAERLAQLLRDALAGRNAPD